LPDDPTSVDRPPAAGLSSSQGGFSPAEAPPITLPKGGGAIRGIGEKFAVSPASGMGTLSVPLGLSPGRSGFGPDLALSYHSGSPNGPLGMGWSLTLPEVTRKTDKGLPAYRDLEESDVFLLSGADDLVPVLDENGTRLEETKTAPGFTIHRYRPRVEGQFARIERWTNRADGDVHWRSISRDNVLTVFGKDANSRIADPIDPRRIFSWLICESRDDKGNVVLYDYKPEDGAGVDLADAHQRNRGDHSDVRRTANRYLKRIRYGNREPLLNDAGRRPRFLAELPPPQLDAAQWLFEVVFDYGEHDLEAPASDDDGEWSHRDDAFSTYRAGFEVRTARLCRRVLMFHHFPDEADVGQNCLVRSTDLTFSHLEDEANVRRPAYAFLRAISQCGYRRRDVGYFKRSLPPLEFSYSESTVEPAVRDVDEASLENLPVGVDGSGYQWTDLHGEGIPGILSEQAGAWFYRRNLSPISERPVEFGPVALVASKPALYRTGGHSQFMDIAGDGLPDLVVLDGPSPGLFEHDEEEGWQPFTPFVSRVNRTLDDPNVKLVDLDGDGHADVLITEDDALVWHRSLAEAGFDHAQRVPLAANEETGPRLVFADGTNSVYLADFSGDGLADLVRIRNGEICYWPNLGYGSFGAKVAMDRSPTFDQPDRFDSRRIRLADIDGTGTTDVIYLHSEGVRLYFNCSGNSWTLAENVPAFPQFDDLVAVTTTDLFGNGTACLTWSSPLPGDGRRQMRYVDLMGGQKPHLLVAITNNLGAETRVTYASSIKYFLEDRRQGRSWITRLPFPVHVVERVETYDYVSRNRFVSRYAYHHGYFDPVEREFGGFGMVEHWDSEVIGALSEIGSLLPGDNVEAASVVPPVHTKTWFHTGAFLGRDHISDVHAVRLDVRDRSEYYCEPGLTDEEAAELGLDVAVRARHDSARARERLLPDSVLPDGLSVDEEREACRALKNAMLHQEVYALDGTSSATMPYTVSEQNFTIRCLQRRGGNRHAVFSSHARETLHYYYERRLAPVLDGEIVDEAVGAAHAMTQWRPDPRVQHALTLEVDAFGNVLKEAAIGYGRRLPSAVLPLPTDREAQTKALVTYTESGFTNPIDSERSPDDYRGPLPCETRAYELTGYAPSGPGGRFRDFDFVRPDPVGAARLIHVRDSEIEFEAEPTNGRQRRLIDQRRTLYRRDDLEGLLALGELETLAITGESYTLTFTQSLLDQTYVRNGVPLLPSDPAAVLRGGGGDRAGYVLSHDLRTAGLFPGDDPDDHWWTPSGRIFLSLPANDGAAQELSYARNHFFLPARYRSPHHTDAVPVESVVTYDRYDLLMVETIDHVGNRVTVGERRPDNTIDPEVAGNSYRVLQPQLVMDINRNRSQVAFDSLGLVTGTAVMGKPEENEGDSLAGFEPDLPEAVILDYLGDPLVDPQALVGRATSRLIYDVFAYQRTSHERQPQPVAVSTLTRETHDADLPPSEHMKVQIAFSYSDGFGREIQKKVQAEPETVQSPPRWVGSGWTVFNNKGNPVRRYEPFFTSTHRFEFNLRVGVSPVLFYDPVGRVVATLHPNDTYEKVVFDPWRRVTWDVNDTVLRDPRTDPDIGGLTERYIAELSSSDGGWRTWYAQRWAGDLGPYEQTAAERAAAHADTPTTIHFDTLGRPFLTLVDNGPGAAEPSRHELFPTRVVLDIKGNQQIVRDAVEQSGGPAGRIVMHYAYDMLNNRIFQLGMDAGARWVLADVSGKPIRAWDSRGHNLRTEYDPLRRPLRSFVAGADASDQDHEVLTERFVYGEQHPEREERNLRGRLYLHLDQSGALVSETFDFKGNELRNSRRLTSGTRYRTLVDWSGVDADPIALPTTHSVLFEPVALSSALTQQLEPDPYVSATTYDALNRPLTVTSPHTRAMRPSVIRRVYNEANLLERVEVNLRSAEANGEPVWTTFVRNIDYDPKGQRRRVEYGNGVTTRYEYDLLTFRLVRLITQRDEAVFPGDCPEPPPTDWPGCQVQNLHYTYDPVGNITSIRDHAQQTVFFRNRRVEPSSDYTYDALNRLICAAGREHLGQVDGAPIRSSYDDAPRVGIAWSANDGNAMGRYIERYGYDAAGNLLKVRHRGSHPANPGWTRTYAYREPSLIEDGTNGMLLKLTNRLSATTVGHEAPERYCHDAHGNTTRMPHLGGTYPEPNIHWDYRDQIRQIDLRDGGTAYYVYDAGGLRVRKVVETSAGVVEERLYLGGFEIFRRRQRADLLERETLHIVDDKQRIALVETRIADTARSDRAPRRLIRYQLADHLGSACLELDRRARIISYEEYTPYGSTSYQSVRSRIGTPKRYRYTGKERDEESGLAYHGARYYAPWLGRWTRADPLGIAAGLNVYVYAAANPVRLTDPSGRQPQQPPSQGVLMGLWDYGQKLLNRAALGRNVQLDHPIQVAARVAQRTADSGAALYSRAISKAEGELTVIVETGKGLFHTELGKLQAPIRNAMRSGQLSSESEIVALTKAAYARASQITGAVVNELALDTAILSNQATVHTTLANTVEELKAVTSGATTITNVSADVERAFAATAQIAPEAVEAVTVASKFAPVVKALQPVAGFVGRVAGPLGIGIGVTQMATAKTTEGKIDGGITAVSSALMMSPHPVAKAAGGGLAAGQLIEKTLDVSHYSSSAGMWVNEGLQSLGANETFSVATGGVVTVLATPAAIGVAAVDKTYNYITDKIGYELCVPFYNCD
jgi:RHS repeat-associated protein